MYQWKSLSSFSLCLLECSSPPPLEVECGAQGVPGYIHFQCYTTNNVELVTCSIDEGEAVPCNFPLGLDVNEYGDGQHTLLVRWTDVYGQTAEIFKSISLSYPQEVLSKYVQLNV